MEPIASASAIVGMMNVIANQAPKGLGFVNKNIKEAYTGVQAEQKKLAAAQNYIRRYDQRHCQVKVMPGLMKEPLPLDEIYTEVKLLDDQSIRYFLGLDDLEETYRAKGLRSFGRGDAEREDGMKIANAEQYLMVLGGPGIGKSTFLRKIGLEALKPQQDETKQIHRDCIPVLIELKEFRDETVDLKQKIADEFATCGFPEALAFTEASLDQGKLLVLLDGLDEVPTRNLTAVIEHIEDFVDTHDQNAFVASCRIAAYRSSQGTFFNRFTDVTLAEFDDEQIEQFIRRWFRSELDQEAGTADRYWELLQKDEHTATKELAQTPLLLTFLCLVYDREQTLPAQRSTLYGKALNILLSEWAAQKRLEQDPIYEGFHADLEKVLLAEIAYESFKNDQLFFLKDDLTRRISEFLADTLDAPKHLDGAAVLQAIEKQQGILVERATDIYSFSHLTLQEYLTAFHIVDQRLEDILIDQYLTDKRWHEVFLLVAGLSGNRAINFLNGLYIKAQEYLDSNNKVRDLLSYAVNQDDMSKDDCSLEERLDIVSSILGLTITINAAKAESPFVELPGLEHLHEAFDRLTLLKKSGERFGLVLLTGVATVARTIGQCNSNEDEVDNHLQKLSDCAMHITNLFRNLEIVEAPARVRELIIHIPQDNASAKSWNKWADEFEAFWIEIFGIDRKELIFSEMEALSLKEYIYTIELLIRCKDSAVRIPKQAWEKLEAGLLMV